MPIVQFCDFFNLFFFLFDFACTAKVFVVVVVEVLVVVVVEAVVLLTKAVGGFFDAELLVDLTMDFVTSFFPSFFPSSLETNPLDVSVEETSAEETSSSRCKRNGKERMTCVEW